MASVASSNQRRPLSVFINVFCFSSLRELKSFDQTVPLKISVQNKTVIGHQPTSASSSALVKPRRRPRSLRTRRSTSTCQPPRWSWKRRATRPPARAHRAWATAPSARTSSRSPRWSAPPSWRRTVNQIWKESKHHLLFSAKPPCVLPAVGQEGLRVCPQLARSLWFTLAVNS